jgi:hypothetical protein
VDSWGHTDSLIISNQWPVAPLGITITELERNLALSSGVDSSKIDTPTPEQNATITNTFCELAFAMERVHETNHFGEQPKCVVIVANHLHMRRTIATAQKLFRGSGIRLYWYSVCRAEQYGRGYSQMRFMHPMVFLGYEILAMFYSKLVGWV